MIYTYVNLQGNMLMPIFNFTSISVSVDVSCVVFTVCTAASTQFAQLPLCTISTAASVQFTRLPVHSSHSCQCTVCKAANVQFARLPVHSLHGCQCTVCTAASVTQ